jgi:hypothetical protein
MVGASDYSRVGGREVVDQWRAEEVNISDNLSNDYLKLF